jgi:hypothetical protein
MTKTHTNLWQWNESTIEFLIMNTGCLTNDVLIYKQSKQSVYIGCAARYGAIFVYSGIINRRVNRHSIMEALDKGHHVKLIYFLATFFLLHAAPCWLRMQNTHVWKIKTVFSALLTATMAKCVLSCSLFQKHRASISTRRQANLS